ncbi:FHA domain-containing protein [bacterium]|nr:FHA domain-containing protein [bacterium]
MAKLTIMINDRPARIYRIIKKITIGRDSESDVQVLDQKVSRRHISIEKLKGFFILKDLSSRNGTYLNDVRVDRTELKAGDRIRIGNTQMTFGEEPYVDSAENTETGDMVVPKDESEDPISFQYEPHRLKDYAENLSKQNELKAIIRQLSEMLAFAGYNRPLESASIVFQGIQDIIHEMIPTDRSFIIIRNRNTDKLETVAVRSTDKPGHEPDFERSLFRRVYFQGVSLLSQNGFEAAGKKSRSVFSRTARSAICVPLRYGSKILGMIYIDARRGSDRFTKDDLITISAIAAIAGIQVDTLQSYKELQTRSTSFLLVMAELAENNLDSKQKGRSRRIAGRVRMIANCMGLPDDQVELITGAAFISSLQNHVSKPDAITETLPEGRAGSNDEEPEIMRIMDNLPNFKEVTRIVRHCNENFDGSGVPNNLSGNDIPLGSRIIRTVLLMEEIDETEATKINAGLQLFTGSILDPMVLRAVKQCLAGIVDNCCFEENTEQKSGNKISIKNKEK